MPKETTSASESSCSPNADVAPVHARDAPVQTVQDRREEDEHRGVFEPPVHGGIQREIAAEHVAHREKGGQHVHPPAHAAPRRRRGFAQGRA